MFLGHATSKELTINTKTGDVLKNSSSSAFDVSSSSSSETGILFEHNCFLTTFPSCKQLKTIPCRVREVILSRNNKTNAYLVLDNKKINIYRENPMFGLTIGPKIVKIKLILLNLMFI